MFHAGTAALAKSTFHVVLTMSLFFMNEVTGAPEETLEVQIDVEKKGSATLVSSAESILRNHVRDWFAVSNFEHDLIRLMLSVSLL